MKNVKKMVNKHCNIILSDTYIKYKKKIITIIIEMRIYIVLREVFISRAKWIYTKYKNKLSIKSCQNEFFLSHFSGIKSLIKHCIITYDDDDKYLLLWETFFLLIILNAKKLKKSKKNYKINLIILIDDKD